MSLDTNFFKKKYSENININENLAKYSWFNLGDLQIFYLNQAIKK